MSSSLAGLLRSPDGCLFPRGQRKSGSLRSFAGTAAGEDSRNVVFVSELVYLNSAIRSQCLLRCVRTVPVEEALCVRAAWASVFETSKGF
mmetsp:Transcript_18250/g.26492  ORF Transcript_18250/g.26492 Transcript_18250/m.26492 type:complete len:90 (+) Transcript_18250:113-382(+)